MLAIRLDKELEKEIDLLAKSRGSNRSAVVREAIIKYLEDWSSPQKVDTELS